MSDSAERTSLRLAELVAAADGDPAKARDALLTATAGLLESLGPSAEDDELLRDTLQKVRDVAEEVRREPRPERTWEDMAVLLILADILTTVQVTLSGSGDVTLPSVQVEGRGTVVQAGTARAEARAFDATVVMEDYTTRPLVPVERTAAVLASMPETVGMETNLARSPIWQEGRSAVRQLALWRSVGSLYGRPFRLLTPQGPLTVRDALLLSHLTRRYAEDGFPEDRRVRFALNEGARWQGYSTEGGRQRQLVRSALGRLRASTFEHLARFPDGHEETLTWGILDLGRTTTRDGGRGMAVLSEPLAQLIRGGSLTYLHAPTFRELVSRDELAARLWLFLETESYSSGRAWRYGVYSAPEGDPEADRDTPAIADLLHLSDWGRRRQAAQRIRKAASVVSELDPRYSLGVERAKRGRGMWNVTVSYGSKKKPGIPGGRGVPGGAQGGTGRRATSDKGGTGRRARGVPGGAHLRTNQGGTVESITVESLSTVGRLSADAETGATSRRRVGEDKPEDVAALLERWPKVTAGQRRSLQEVAERHGGEAWAASIIRDTPEDGDPFRAVMDADRRWQSERRDKAEAEERAWAETKAEEAKAAEKLGEKLGELVRDMPVAPALSPEEAKRRQRRAELDAYLRHGVITEAQHAELLRELEDD